MTSRDPAQLRRRSGRWRLGLVAAGLPLVVGLSACSTVSPAETSRPADPVSVSVAPDAKAPAVPSPESNGASPSGSPTAAPAGASRVVEAALQTLLASSPRPSREQIQASLAAAGVAPAAVEVSSPRTPTGLAADAVEVGVLGNGECVMAQIRPGTVAMSVLPVLPSGRCFIGSVQR